MDCIIVLSSVTYAMKAQKLLAASNIPSRLTKSSAVKAVRGCGHGVEIECALINRAKGILNANGVKIIGEIT